MNENLLKLINEVEIGNPFGEKVYIVGATKMQSVDVINDAIRCGLNIVAENRVQEFREKTSLLLPCEQHFIGHLQTNKVKYLIGKVSLIQSVDSVNLALKISEESIKKGVTTNVLIEVNVGGELSKSGFNIQNIERNVRQISQIPSIKVLGLMAMLPKTDDESFLISLCTKMREVYDKLKDEFDFQYLSMGMSGDYKTAIKCGSNMIRVGSHIFGKRIYEVN